MAGNCTCVDDSALDESLMHVEALKPTVKELAALEVQVQNSYLHMKHLNMNRWAAMLK